MGNSFKEKVASRKFILMLLIFSFSTFCLALPATSALLGVPLAALMTGGEYVSLIIGTFGIYSGANVFQKKLESKNNVSMEEGEL